MPFYIKKMKDFILNVSPDQRKLQKKKALKTILQEQANLAWLEEKLNLASSDEKSITLVLAFPKDLSNSSMISLNVSRVEDYESEHDYKSPKQTELLESMRNRCQISPPVDHSSDPENAVFKKLIQAKS